MNASKAFLRLVQHAAEALAAALVDYDSKRPREVSPYSFWPPTPNSPTFVAFYVVFVHLAGESAATLVLTLSPSGGMADATDSKSVVRKGVWVRIPPRALHRSSCDERRFGAFVRMRVMGTSGRFSVADGSLVRAWLFGCRPLRQELWEQRHRVVLGVLGVHVPLLVLYALVARPYPLQHMAIDLVPLVACALIGWLGQSRRTKELATSLGMLVASAAVVHLGGGWVELHFHFFFALGFVSLYQSRVVLLIAILFTFVHHFAVGELAANAVWVNSAEEGGSLTWALIHSVYVLLVSMSHVEFWRNAERSELVAEESYKKLYEGERAVVAQLEEAQRIKDELVATVSHEFRTPLTSVAGFARLLKERDEKLTPEARQEYTAMIVSQADRLSRLVENLLNSAGATRRDDLVPVDVPATVEGVVRSLEPIVDTSHRIDVHCAPNAISAMAMTWPDALEQILVNLLTNALKFSPAGSPVDVTVTLAGEAVVVEVANEGPQLSDSDRHKMFRPFVQLDASHTRPAPGVGLGLAIVERLITACGGDVAVRNETNKVVFTISLVLAPSIRAGGGEPAHAGS